MDTESKSKNKAILKSTSLLGGSSLITMFIGMVKTKFVAVLLGPSGVGFMSVLNGLREIVSTVIGMGLNSSGVRQIAACNGTGDERATARAVKTLRTLVWCGGIAGLLAMILGSGILSDITFKTTEHAASIAWLGLAVLAVAVSAGQICVLQGLRQIKNVAMANILGAVAGATLSVLCFLFWGTKGIVPALILTSFSSLAASWWFAHKITFSDVKLDKHNFGTNAKALYSVGLPIAASGLLTTGSAYAVRLYLIRTAGLGSVGMYQAAFTLSGVLVNFVLSAMGTDYYPRLSAICDDDKKINEEVNAQTEIALLLTIPALAVTVSFLPFIVSLLYSSKFDGSTGILRWAVFGVLGRVVSWPMGFILLAKARSVLFLVTETITNVINVLLVIVCYSVFGIEGCGIAFALLYLWQFFLMLIISKKIANVSWSVTLWLLVVSGAALIGFLVLIQSIGFLFWVKSLVCVVLTAFTSYLSLLRLSKITGISGASIYLRLRRQRYGDSKKNS